MKFTGLDVSGLKKCVCSGTPEVLRDREGDFLIRCMSCHESTYSYMGLDQASEAWNAGKTAGRLDIMTDDPKRELSGNISCILMDNYCDFIADVYELPDDYDKKLLITNEDMSVRFTDAIIVYKDGRGSVSLQADEDAVIEASIVGAYNKEIWTVKIEPEAGPFCFESAALNELGNITGLRFLFGDSILVFDGRNGSIYVIDKQGNRLPVPVDFIQ